MTGPTSMNDALVAGGGDGAGFSTLAGLTEGFWHSLWFRQPGTTNAEHTDWLGMWLFWFCAVWFVALMLIMFYFVVRYRRSKVGPVAPASSAHNTPIELAWTVIPSLFLVFMFFKGFWGYIDNLVAPANATEIRVEAQKWSWRFIYPSGAETRSSLMLGSKEQPIFYVPAGRPVQLRLKSNDVMHAVWIPDFRIKADALPNRFTTLWFEAKKLDTDQRLSEDKEKLVNEKNFAFLKGVPYVDHWLFCAEYCGDNHSEMAATIRVVPDDIYRKWIAAIGDIGDLPLAKQGEIIYKSQCSSCHTVVPGATSTGPNWTEVWGNPEIPITGQPSVKGDADYVRESVRNPSTKIHQGFPNSMTPFPQSLLSDQKLEAIMAYMKYISKFTSQEVKDEVMQVPQKEVAPK